MLYACLSAFIALALVLCTATSAAQQVPDTLQDTGMDISVEAPSPTDADWPAVLKKLKTRAIAHSRAGNQDAAIHLYQQGLQLARTHKLESSEADLLLNLANACEDIGDYATAIANYEAALPLFKKLRDSFSAAKTNHNMGVLALHMGDARLAKTMFLTALQHFLAMHKMEHVAGSYNAVAGSLYKLQSYTEALSYLSRARLLNDSLHLQANAAITEMNFGLCYQELNKPDSALQCYNRALKLFRNEADLPNEILLLQNMGSIYEETFNRNDIAKEHYIQSLELARRTNYPMGMSLAYHDLAALATKTKDYKSATEYMQQEMQIRDTLLNQEKLSALRDLAARQRTRELSDRNQLLQKENDLQQLRLRNKDLLIASGCAAALLSLIIGVLLVWYTRLKTNQQKLELEQKQLRARINPHFIFNCLNSIQKFVVDNDKLNANKYLADFAHLMRQTLDNSGDSTISLLREIEYLENYLTFELMRFEDRFNFTINCAPDLDTNSIEIPSMIIQPFAENAIRHGLCNLDNKPGELIINFHSKDNFLYCEINDNGIGINQAMKLKEQAYIRHQSHGLELTRQRLALAAKLNKADYSITITDKSDINAGNGTRVILKFPLHL